MAKRGKPDPDEVRELARSVVERAFPKEMRQFDSQADAWFADPARARAGDGSGNGPLGSGLAAVLVPMAHLALFLADHVLSAAIDFGIEQAAVQGIRKIRRSRGKDATDADTPRQPEPEEIRRLIVEAGTAYKADEETVRKFADGFVAAMCSPTAIGAGTDAAEPTKPVDPTEPPAATQ